jgi:EAL domain-containing protein (putative c-di-GMP-specific phosphodiesterase class I)
MENNLFTLAQDPSLADVENLDESLKAAAASFRKLLNFDISYISRFENSHQVIEAVDLSDSAADIPIKKGSAFNVEESYCKRVADNKLPKFVLDAKEEPLVADIPAIAELSIGTLISVPITMRDGRLYGSICGFSRTIRNDISERDVRFVELLAEFASRVLESSIAKSGDLRKRHDFIVKIISNRSFQNVYQSIVDFTTGKNVGLEALTRFEDVSFESPDWVFREAEHFGLKSELEIAVLHEPIKRTHAMSGDCYVSINVSPATVATKAFKDLVATAATDHLVIELNEADTVDCYFALNNHLDKVRELGVSLAIDDVGSGYANFRHILELSPEILKLDISLIRDINISRKKQALAAAIAAYADEFGSKIIAEGVETDAELQILQKLGINLIQGYLFSKPAPW